MKWAVTYFRIVLPVTLRIAVISCCLIFVGCARHYDVNLLSQSTVDQGHTTIIVTTGHPGGEFAILLRGKQYNGRWIYVANGGSAAYGTTSGFSGSRAVMASGTSLVLPTQGGGSVIASASDGSTLRCQYYFNAFSRSGVGVCQGNDGAGYDLQITPA